MQNIITSSPLIWAGLLAGMVMLPLLIHLINRLRHKQVPWAAMEFLLVSHKKNRNWVWLRQWLLLLARIACLLLLLLTLGQVGCQHDNLSRLLGTQLTHHYIIVDDSLSMSDTADGVSAMDRARQVLGLIAGRWSGKENQRVTLLRYSQAHQIPDFNRNSLSEDPDGDRSLSMLDLNAVVVDRDTERLILGAAERLQATALALNAGPALQVVADLVEQRTGENALVYLVSDFRYAEWSAAESVQGSCDALTRAGAGLEWIRCVTKQSQNLAITALQPAGSVRVAGVPLMIEIQITNFGTEPVRKIQVALQSATYPDETSQNLTPNGVSPELDDLPALFVDAILPGETAVRQFPVFFSRPGQHAVKASLPADAMPGDNSDWVVTRFSTADKVLVIDGGDADSGKFLALALAPGGMTGLQIDSGNKALLRDSEDTFLDQYESIFLLDLDRLEDAAVQRLRNYLERGGGLVFFAGPETNLQHYSTTLYADGNGIFPLPLSQVTAIPEQLAGASGDIVPSRHPIFASVLDVDFSPLDLVQITRVCQPPVAWSATRDNKVVVLATVRGSMQLPLVVEKKVGSGTVLAVLTSAGAEWNNWLRNPTFPTTLLMIQDYVSRGRRPQLRQWVGTRQTIAVPTEKYRPKVAFVGPTNSSENPGFERTIWTATANPADRPEETAVVLGQSTAEVSQPGVYEIWRTTNRGGVELKRQVLHVNDLESRPTLATREDLSALAEQARVVDWQDFAPGVGRNRGTSLVRSLLLLLLVGLVLEQWLAYRASYHPRAASARPQPSNRGRVRKSRLGAGNRVA